MPWDIEPTAQGFVVVDRATRTVAGRYSSLPAARAGHGELVVAHNPIAAALATRGLWLEGLKERVPHPVRILETTADTYKWGGYGVIYESRDLYGTHFTRNTNFMMDLVPLKLNMYDHGFDPVVKRTVFYKFEDGNIRDSDKGMWIEGQLQRHQEYAEAIAELIEMNVLGLSSGSIGHLIDVEWKSGWIKQWPIVEWSLTPTPAEPKTLGVNQIMSLSEVEPSLEAVAKAAQGQAASAAGTGETSRSELPYEIRSQESNMPVVENGQPTQAATPQDPPAVPTVMTRTDVESIIQSTMRGLQEQWQAQQLEPLQQSVQGLQTSIDRILDAMESSPPVRNAGYFSGTGGASDPQVKSFGDFLMAIKRRDHVRLSTVYRSGYMRLPEQQDDNTRAAAPWDPRMTETSGEAGGYLVPEEYETELLQIATSNNPLFQRVRKIPVGAPTGRWPVLDQFLTPTPGSGQTAAAAGVQGYNTGPGQELEATQPRFEMLRWTLHKIGGYTPVDNELIADSPMAIEALLKGLFGIAIGAKNERNILRGSGVGEPLGILNSNAIVNVTPAIDGKFSWQDVAVMQSRYLGAGGTPAWILHPSVWPDILTMELGTAGGNTYVANMASANGQASPLLGYPTINSEHSPQADNSGDVILADLSAYLWFHIPGLLIAFSEHAGFLSDQSVWRFTQRADGMPWLRNPITLADPQGNYTMSPFVVHND